MSGSSGKLIYEMNIFVMNQRLFQEKNNKKLVFFVSRHTTLIAIKYNSAKPKFHSTNAIEGIGNT